MILIDELRAEHELIDRVLGSLRSYVKARRAGDGDARDAERFVAFFRLWAGHYHHAREDDVLFPALARALEVPIDRGPIAALSGDHRSLAATLERLAPLLGGDLGDPARGAAAQDLAVDYSRVLWLHIDAEDSVLFPESETRLARAGVRELPGRDPTPDEIAARDGGVALVLRYAPVHDPAVMRGEGCVMCPAYGERCNGIEREWWSENEWEEAPDRFG